MHPPPRLVVPTTAVHRSFVVALSEDDPMASRSDAGLAYANVRGDELAAPERFAEFVQRLVEDAREDSPRPEGHVPSTVRWWVAGHEFLGRIAIRHRMTPWLAEVGGLIGYAVRPSARGRGHATAMLAAALPLAAELGIRDALLTADPDNLASRRVIEANNGRFVEQRGGKAHYLVATS